MSDRLAPHAERLAALALAAVAREYPSQVAHRLDGDADARPPRELTPSFYGSYDWHSSVHGHWCLARLARRVPAGAFVPAARAALARALAPQPLAGELAYLSRPGREGFERPYGLAWLLQLAAELRAWEDGAARGFGAALEPLERLAARRLVAYAGGLPWPVRGGEHGQTAFALGLALDWARGAGEDAAAAALAGAARRLYRGDRDAPIGYEPSGHDFLSPALAEADLMRRVLDPGEWRAWLDDFLPDLLGERGRRWLTPVASPDPADGKLSHLDGLALSRAWMLEGIAAALPAADRRVAPLLEAAARHGATGLAAVSGEHWAGAHWLASFAVYWLSARGAGPG